MCALTSSQTFTYDPAWITYPAWPAATPIAQLGWKCPECGTIWAPFVACCTAHEPVIITNSGDTSDPPLA